jgi:hypothetical protein
LQHAGDFADRFSHVERHPLNRLALEESANARDDFARARAVAQDTL